MMYVRSEPLLRIQSVPQNRTVIIGQNRRPNKGDALVGMPQEKTGC
jgi:hypothetical protein